MKRSSSWYLPGDLSILLSPGTKNLPFPCQIYSRGKGINLFIKVLGARTYFTLNVKSLGSVLKEEYEPKDRPGGR